MKRIDVRALRKRTKQSAMQIKTYEKRKRQREETESRRVARPHLAAAKAAIAHAAKLGQSEAVISHRFESVNRDDARIKLDVQGSRVYGTYRGGEGILEEGVSLGLFIWARKQGLKPRVEYSSSYPPLHEEVKIVVAWD